MVRSARKQAKAMGSAEYKRTEDLDKLKHDYDERVKELSCLYRFYKIVETLNISLDGILERTNCLLPKASPYPEVTCSRIVLRKQEFRTKNFIPTKWKQQASIKIHGRKAGFVEVCYLEEKPIIAEGSFLTEKRQLLTAIAERLGRIIERRKAEDALRESEQRWATTVSSIGDAVIATDVVGKITFMNRIAEKLTKWTLKDALQKPIGEVFKIINEFTRQEVEDPVAKVIMKGVVIGLANHSILVRKDGTEVAIDDSGAPIKDKDGKLTGVVLVFRDITERRKAEQDGERLLQETVESNRKLSCFYGLASLVETPGISLDETLQGAPDLLSRAYKYPDIACSRIVLEGKEFKTDNFEESQWKQCSEITLNGQKIGVLEIYYLQEKPTIDEGPFSKEERYLIDAIAERLSRIIERRKAEDTLLSSEKKYRTLFETSQDGITARDLNGRMIDCNQAYARMVGFSKKKLLHLPVQELLPEKWNEQRDRIFKQVLESGGSAVFECEYRRKDGVVFPASVRSWRLTDENGETIGVWSIVRNITQQKKMESKLQEYAANLEKLVEERTEELRGAERLAAIGATAGMVGHDIRNPLQAIIGDLYLLKSDLSSLPEGEERESMKESLEDIETNVTYVNKIVQDLQDFARPIKPISQEVDIQNLCEAALFKNGVPDNIDASCQVEKEAKKQVTDPDVLKRILSNLVKNAIQAMPKGGKLAVHAYQEAGGTAITVQDTGGGIPEEIKAKLFTPLVTTKSKGQGFGLAVVKRMTEALGGTITFESEVGKGTKFILRLPPK